MTACLLCTGGVLGTFPDGERVFCTCTEGIQATIAESRCLMMAYAEQLETFDRHGVLPPSMKQYRDVIQTQYDAELLIHDYYVDQVC